MFKKIAINLTVLASILRVKAVERDGITDPRELYLKASYLGEEYITPYGTAIASFPDLQNGVNTVTFSTHELPDCTDTPLVIEEMVIKTFLNAPEVNMFSKTNDSKLNLDAVFTEVDNLITKYSISGVEKVLTDKVTSDTALLDGEHAVSFFFEDEQGFKSVAIVQNVTVDTVASMKPVVVGSLNSQSTVITFEWQNTEIEKNDISKYRYKLTGESEFTEVSKEVTTVTKDVKVNGSYTIIVNSCDKSGINWSEDSTFTTVVSSLSVSSLKFVDVVDQKLFIKNSFKDLTESFDSSYIKNRLPLFFIQTTIEDLILAPSVVKISVVENVVKNMIDENIQNASDAAEIKAVTKLVMQIRAIEKQYGDKPFVLCISTNNFCDLMTTSVDPVDIEFRDMLYAEKRIKAVIDMSLNTASGSYFVKANEIMKDFIAMYFAIDKNESLAMNSDTLYKLNSEKFKAFRYTPSSLNNFVPDFNISETAGITDAQFRVPVSDLGISEDEFYVIADKNGFVFDPASDFLGETFYDLSAKEIALPVIASEFYNSYNNIQVNGPLAEIYVGYEPIKFMKGKGFKNQDIADDFKSVNMTSVIDQDGAISKICFKNEHSLNIREANVKIGVERTREVVYATMKRLEDEKAIKPSNLMTINLALDAAKNNLLNNIAESISIECSFKKKIVNSVEKEVLSVYIKEVYDVRYSKIEVENEIYFK